MNIAEAMDLLGEDDDFTLFADGFDEAFIGLGRRNHQYIAIYSEPIALGMLLRQMEEACPRGADCSFAACDHPAEAREHFEFNVVGAYVGEGTPLWLDYEGELVFE